MDILTNSLIMFIISGLFSGLIFFAAFWNCVLVTCYPFRTFRCVIFNVIHLYVSCPRSIWDESLRLHFFVVLLLFWCVPPSHSDAMLVTSVFLAHPTAAALRVDHNLGSLGVDPHALHASKMAHRFGKVTEGTLPVSAGLIKGPWVMADCWPQSFITSKPQWWFPGVRRSASVASQSPAAASMVPRCGKVTLHSFPIPVVLTEFSGWLQFVWCRCLVPKDLRDSSQL